MQDSIYGGSQTQSENDSSNLPPMALSLPQRASVDSDPTTIVIPSTGVSAPMVISPADGVHNRSPSLFDGSLQSTNISEFPTNGIPNVMSASALSYDGVAPHEPSWNIDPSMPWASFMLGSDFNINGLDFPFHRPTHIPPPTASAYLGSAAPDPDRYIQQPPYTTHCDIPHSIIQRSWHTFSEPYTDDEGGTGDDYDQVDDAYRSSLTMTLYQGVFNGSLPSARFLVCL